MQTLLLTVSHWHQSLWSPAKQRSIPLISVRDNSPHLQLCPAKIGQFWVCALTHIRNALLVLLLALGLVRLNLMLSLLLGLLQPVSFCCTTISDTLTGTS